MPKCSVTVIRWWVVIKKPSDIEQNIGDGTLDVLRIKWLLAKNSKNLHGGPNAICSTGNDLSFRVC